MRAPSGLMRFPADACVEVPETRSACRRGPSRPAALLLVIVLGIEFDGIEEVDDLRLLAPLDELVQRLSHGRFLRSEAADFLGFTQQGVVDCEVGSHVRHSTQTTV